MAEQKILKAGVFGLWRGAAHIMAMEVLDNVEVIAICDRDPQKVEEVKKHCSADVQVCRDFDELLSSGIELVVLCNYLPDHAACAIQALRRGIAVVTECLAASTMKECVELVEAVEETGVYFSMAENSPYGTACLEMQRVYGSGILGDVVYAEAEYCHPSAPDLANQFSPGADHWRKRLPKTYYLTHSLGPLMNMTRLMPRRIIGKVAACPSYARRRGSTNGDSAGIMLVEMDGGALFRITGCSSYGPETHWFRLACEKGGVESVRTAEDTVNLAIEPWDLPEDMTSQGCNTFYTPQADAATREAVNRGLPNVGHQLTDFRCVRNYVTEILEGKAPDMDVYRSCAQSAVAILGWRSVLNDSRQYDIPDFKIPAQREPYRCDDLSPWNGSLPFSVYSVE